MSYTDALQEVRKELNDVNVHLASIDGYLAKVNGNVARHERKIDEHDKIINKLEQADAVAVVERTNAQKDRDSIKDGLQRVWDAIGKPAVAALLVYALTQVFGI